MEELAKCQPELAEWALTADDRGFIVEMNRVEESLWLSLP
jgi:hypothetical protein